MIERPDPTNVQGLVRSGYSHLPRARFLLFRIDDPAAARAWLETVEVTAAGARREVDSTNIAFTAEGLEALGLDQTGLRSLPIELQEGMTTEHRQRILGDHADSHPDRWDWGGAGEALHGVLLCYGADDAALDACAERALAQGAIRTVHALESEWLPGNKEHFGFRDGMGQPEVRDIHPHDPGRRPIATGEVLLGYPNAYGRMPFSPQVERRSEILGGSDFGRDGSYLVMRQLEQDVAGFWRFAREAADEVRIGERFPDAGDPAIVLASKMVGRWPSGAPLVLSPDRDDESLRDANDFLYAGADPDGLRCPFGSHVRRANPRDWFLGSDPAESRTVADRHRILRRGRAYGPPLARDMDITALSRASDDEKPRGLHFLCLNASIERQFEFIQHHWMNNPKFGGLHGGGDPIAGEHVPKTTARDIRAEMLIPASPVRCRVTNLRRFVTTRGGAYFFLPSLRAIRYLASL